jgi:hypothetical protein
MKGSIMKVLWALFGKQKWILPVAGALLIPGVLGCARLQPYPEKNLFLVECQCDSKAESQSDSPILEIQRFEVAEPFSGKEMVYRIGPLQYESDFYNTYFVPPAGMIGSEVRRCLAGCGVFSQVVGRGSRLKADYLLEAEVTALYGDLSDPLAPKAIVEIAFLVLKPVSGGSEIVLARTWRSETVLEGRGGEALAEGLSVSFGEVMKGLTAEIGKIVK